MKKKFIPILTLVLCVAINACGPDQPDKDTKTTKALAIGTHGMVSSAHPLATEAGLKILQAGGNAFDAAVAIGATLTATEPMMSSIGGYGTILIYDAKTGTTRFLDSSGKIPAGVDANAFRAPTPGFEENRFGPKAVSTPGVVNAWQAMNEQYGTMDWNSLFNTAIEVAEEGFAINETVARCIDIAHDEFSEYAKAIYCKEGSPLVEGDILVQKDLAQTFTAIAKQGSQVFYNGDIADTIDKQMTDTGGFLRKTDLENDKAEFWAPIAIDYRGYQVYTASPPSTAFPSLIRLGLMSCYEVSSWNHNDAEMLHTFIEVTKHAFWCRLKYAGDPEVSPPPLDKLLSKAYWQRITSGIAAESAKPFEYPGIDETTQRHTTHFVVADSEGNIVCATQTLGGLFGSKILVEGKGFWLNNSLSYCTFEPPGNPMDAHPGRRKLSGDCPTIILKDTLPVIAVGTPGGHTIGQTVPQMIMNLLDFNMDMQTALSKPKLAFIEPDLIAAEAGISQTVLEALQAKGHKIEVLPRGTGLSNAHGLTIEYDQSGKPVRFTGGSDGNGSGLAKGY